MLLDEKELNNLIQYCNVYGYRKYNCQVKNEDFSYWKSFEVEYDEDNERFGGYQIVILIWDFYKHEKYSREDKRYGIQFQFSLGTNYLVDRIDLDLCDDDYTIAQFEFLSANFFRFLKENVIGE